jgi:hypothetical protein
MKYFYSDLRCIVAILINLWLLFLPYDFVNDCVKLVIAMISMGKEDGKEKNKKEKKERNQKLLCLAI